MTGFVSDCVFRGWRVLSALSVLQQLSDYEFVVRQLIEGCALAMGMGLSF